MRRLLYAFCVKNTPHYHPTRFKFDLNRLSVQQCPLHFYISLYRKHAHHFARLDPLDLYNRKQQLPRPTDLGINYTTPISSFSYRSPVVAAADSIIRLQQILRKTYQGNTAVQFTHIQCLDEQEWLYKRYEQLMLESLNADIRVNMSKTLIEAEAVDHFLHTKFVTFKRYSGQGAQGTVLALKHLFEQANKSGFQHLVFGMPHRGRLNLLVNVLNYDARYLFRKISGKTDTPTELNQVIDDVTSHLAHSTIKNYENGEMKITLVHNPSHLQAQNPVSMGKTRSKQHIYSKDKVINVQVHGDAAFCAQGVVYQSLLLGKTPNYNVDGTIHIITNNQIGYTTKAIDSRASKYDTDVCKAFDIPIIHVNSQNSQHVYQSVRLAVQYKKLFKKDILIDLICYRKYGHNEVDQPQFTQPKMYHKIRKEYVPVTKTYAKKLHAQNLVSQSFYEDVRKEHFKKLQIQFEESKKIQSISLKQYTSKERKNGARAFTEVLSSMKPSQYGKTQPTGLPISQLKHYAEASIFMPQDFSLHPRIRKYHVEDRVKSIALNKLNWATCEALAMFSLIKQGYNIRLTGQDVERGTFSQRHATIVDQRTQEQFRPLSYFASQLSHQPTVEIGNSALTENAAISYQYGYSLDHPNNLAIWEAQFGDFYNTGQAAVDIFITNSQEKWMRQSSLVLLLPHGFDGAGPQHSSCRMERFLQLANSDGSLLHYKHQQYNADRKHFAIDEEFFVQNTQQANFSMVSPTKPANIYHLLRRQMKRNFRKPLIISGPKTLLRLAPCVSKFEDMEPGTQFQPILPYANCDKLSQCKSVIITCGKFVYDIMELMQNSNQTAVIAIEQLFPFPQIALQQMLKNVNKNVQVYWAQAENINGGAYLFCSNRIQRILNNVGFEKQLRYVGRRAIAATAVGSVEIHKKENQALIDWLKKIIV